MTYFANLYVLSSEDILQTSSRYILLYNIKFNRNLKEFINSLPHTYVALLQNIKNISLVDYFDFLIDMDSLLDKNIVSPSRGISLYEHRKHKILYPEFTDPDININFPYGLLCEIIFGPLQSNNCLCTQTNTKSSPSMFFNICLKCGVELEQKIENRRHNYGYIKLTNFYIHPIYFHGQPSVLSNILNETYASLTHEIYFSIQYILKLNIKPTESYHKNPYKMKLSKTQFQYLQDKSCFSGDQIYNILTKLNILTEIDKINNKLLQYNTLSESGLLTLFKRKRILNLFLLNNLKPQWLCINYIPVLPPSFRPVFSTSTEKNMISGVNKSYSKLISIQNEILDLKLSLNSDEFKLKYTIIFNNFIKKFNHTYKKIINRLRRKNISNLYIKYLNIKHNIMYKKYKQLYDLYKHTFNFVMKNDFRTVAKTYYYNKQIQSILDKLFLNIYFYNKKKYKHTSENSLMSMYSGKYNRFRENIVGKRIDFSARAVIVGGAGLCNDLVGIPINILTELFKPILIKAILNIITRITHSSDGLFPAEEDIFSSHIFKGKSKSLNNILFKTLKHLNKHINNQSGSQLFYKEFDTTYYNSLYKAIKIPNIYLYEIMDDIIENKVLLLNRAPTLHRLNFQAFKPIITNHTAVRLNVLTCNGFNADFDGDQMGIFVPLTFKSQFESRKYLNCAYNIYTPTKNSTNFTPKQGITLGLDILTTLNYTLSSDYLYKLYFSNKYDILNYLENNILNIFSCIWVRTILKSLYSNTQIYKFILTTGGRQISSYFNL